MIKGWCARDSNPGRRIQSRWRIHRHFPVSNRICRVFYQKLEIVFCSKIGISIKHLNRINFGPTKFNRVEFSFDYQQLHSLRVRIFVWGEFLLIFSWDRFVFFVKYIYWSSHSKVTFVNACLQYRYNLWIKIWAKEIGYFYIYGSNIMYVKTIKDK